MANILNALCTCPEFWRGVGVRPQCPVHVSEDRARKIIDRAAAYLAVMADPEPAPWRPRSWSAAA